MSSLSDIGGYFGPYENTAWGRRSGHGSNSPSWIVVLAMAILVGFLVRHEWKNEASYWKSWDVCVTHHYRTWCDEHPYSDGRESKEYLFYDYSPQASATQKGESQ